MGSLRSTARAWRRRVVVWFRSEQRTRRALWPCALGVFLLALLVRMLYVADAVPALHTVGQPGVRMASRYSEAAWALAEGDGLLYPRVAPSRADTALVSRPPGYPAFLALVFECVGSTYVHVLAVQAVLGALVPVLLLVLAARAVGAGVGILAGVLAALSPPLAYFTSELTPDAVASLLGILLLVLVFAGRRAPGLWFVGAGCVAGVATWLRPNFLLLAPALALTLPFLFRHRATFRWSLALVALALVLVAPITVRNWRLYGAFVPVSTNMGIVLWEGIADAGGGRFGAFSGDLDVADDEARRHNEPSYALWWASPDGIERDHERLTRSLGVVRRNPLWFVGACARRAFAVLRVGAAAPALAAAPPARESPDGREKLPAWWPGSSSVLRRVFRSLQLSLLAIGPIARGAGVLLLLLVAPRRALFLLLLPAYVLLLQAPLHFESRFALPLYTLVPVFEAVGWMATGRALLSRRN